MSISTGSNRVKIPWRIERLPSSSYLLMVGTVLILTYFFESIDNGAIGFFLPVYAKEFKLDNATLGFVGTISNIGYMFGALLAGLLSDIFGRKKVIIASMLFWGLCGLMLANAWTLNVLLVARVLLGFGLGAQVPVTITLLSETIPSKLRAKYITGIMALLPIGSAVAGLLSYYLMPIFGWRGVALVEAVPALASLLVLKLVPESAFWLESKGRYEEADRVMARIEKGVEKSIGRPLPPVEIPADQEKVTVKANKVPLRELFTKKYIKSTLMITIWWPAALTGVYGLITWFSALLVARGFTITKSIGYVTIMYFGGVLGIPVIRWMVEKIGRKWTVVIVGVITAMAAYLYGISTALPLIIATGLFYNVCSYATGMVNNLYTPELYPTRIRATAMGYANFVGRMGAVFGPIAIGFIMQGYGITTVFMFAGSMYLLYGIVVALLGKETKGIVFTE